MCYKVFGRVILICTILSVTLSTSGCSFGIDFLIKNLTDRHLTVAYTLRNSDYGLAPELVSKNDSNAADYLKFPAERIKVDFDKRTVEFKLLPGEEVRVLRMRDRQTMDEYEEAFNLYELQLTSSDGRAHFEGRQVFGQFKPVEKRPVVFGPTISRFELEYR